jgi:hypothetical protein
VTITLQSRLEVAWTWFCVRGPLDQYSIALSGLRQVRAAYGRWGTLEAEASVNFEHGTNIECLAFSKHLLQECNFLLNCFIPRLQFALKLR